MYRLFDEADQGQAIAVAQIASDIEARFCESVESGHSNQGESAQIAAILGITGEPYRIDSQCKYAAVARNDASIYLRLPTSETYREKIWDHAAGKLIVEAAGGKVTDVNGNALDFTLGRHLDNNKGIVAPAVLFMMKSLMLFVRCSVKRQHTNFKNFELSRLTRQ
ncbi:3'-phosphoadenosine 5'-phosphatase [gamma proteobacterium IMCC2047]|nr:3'-phosphoadenosine 5'-phosphatase [gamma proteobacterium IMCC2047]